MIMYDVRKFVLFHKKYEYYLFHFKTFENPACILDICISIIDYNDFVIVSVVCDNPLAVWVSFAPASADNWLNRGCAMCHHVCDNAYKDLYLSLE